MAKIDVIICTWQERKAIITSIRDKASIFNTSPADDNTASHFVAYQQQGSLYEPIATATLNKTGLINNIAVLSPYSEQGIEKSMLDSIINYAAEHHFSSIFSHASEELISFYTHLGFDAESEFILDDNKRYKIMKKSVLNLLSTDPLLGADSDNIQLSNIHDFKQHALSLCQQAQQNILIQTPDLEPDLYDCDEIIDAVSRLARRNRYCFVHILTSNIKQAATNGHKLIGIMQRLNTSIKIHVSNSEIPAPSSSFVLVDGCGFVYRESIDQYKGLANYNNRAWSKILSDQFKENWLRSYQSTELRRLAI